MHIIGAGGHAKVVIDVLAANQIKVGGIWDENLELKFFLDYPILGNLAALSENKIDNYIIAIGNNLVRKEISKALIKPNSYIKHPTSAIGMNVEIGYGTVLMANTSVNANAIIGEHVIINTNASVDHDCKIANFVHISPQVGLAGAVEVGEGTHIGIGASVIQGIKIGKWATIGAGTVIIKDVPDYAVVVGNPGKVIKYNSI